MLWLNVKRVCCGCKMIMGYKRGEKQVSHGICLECMKKDHPKVYEKVIKKDPWAHFKERVQWLLGLIRL